MENLTLLEAKERQFEAKSGDKITYYTIYFSDRKNDRMFNIGAMDSATFGETFKKIQGMLGQDVNLALDYKIQNDKLKPCLVDVKPYRK